MKKSKDAGICQRKALIDRGRFSRFGERCRFLHSFLVLPGDERPTRSADWQSAVSQIANLQARPTASGRHGSTNLGRLLEIFTELREDSQLIVVTHQKRTMEIGDALYGVTMRGDGVTTVISQRLTEASA